MIILPYLLIHDVSVVTVVSKVIIAYHSGFLYTSYDHERCAQPILWQAIYNSMNYKTMCRVLTFALAASSFKRSRILCSYRNGIATDLFRHFTTTKAIYKLLIVIDSIVSLFSALWDRL